MTGISKDVMQILGGKQDRRSAALPPIVPTFPIKATGKKSSSGAATSSESDAATTNKPETKVKVGNRVISSSKPARKWVWAPFTSSARPDGAKFRHWVRAGVEYPDYPYARFDIHLDAVSYTDQEYQRYLQHKTWTKSETDKLMELVRRLELRWAVIHDRWCDYADQTDTAGLRKIEDLQHRYYTVAATLLQVRIAKEASSEVAALSSATPDPEHAETHMMDTAAARAIATAEHPHQPLIANIATGTTNKEIFDLQREKQRRAYLEVLWNRTKEDELEEAELRKELRLVEAQLKKLKKSGSHILAAGSRSASRAVSPVMDTAALLEKSFASTAPTPMPETPYLQSGRLVPPATGGQGGLNKSTLKRMDSILEELKVPNKPIPTKRVCDLYDSVRKDALTLLALQKFAMQQEGQLQAKRLRLAKMGGGGRVVEEETLLGIAPAPAPVVAPAPAARSKAKPKGSRAATGSKAKAASARGAAGSKAGDEPGGKGVRKTTGTKRKKKNDPKTTPPVPASTSPVPIAANKDTPLPGTLHPLRPEAADDGKQQAKKRARKS